MNGAWWSRRTVERSKSAKAYRDELSDAKKLNGTADYTTLVMLLRQSATSDLA